MSNRFYSANFLTGSFGVELFARTGLTANYSLGLPNIAPTDGQYLKWNSAAGAFIWDVPAGGGGGTVNSVGLSLPNIFTVGGSPVSSTGTLSATLNNQAANSVFAAPTGAVGVPTFRALVNADIPSGIDASKISGTLAKSNIPSGTNATSFQLNGINGVTLGTDAGGNLYIYGSDGSTITDLFVRNLNVSGTVDTVASTNTNIGDSTLTMLSGFVGTTPATDVNFTVKRGTQTNASLRWNEAVDRWQVGLDDNLRDISRTASTQITNANISGGNFVFTHNLRCTDKSPTIVVKRDDGRQIALGVTFTSVDTVTIDFSRVGTISGTWEITASN